MIRYLYGSDLARHPRLAHSMFADRARQFKTRLGWDVTLDKNGAEKDQYDALDPLYVICQRGDGCHGGSMRFLPTIGRTMVNEHFLHLTDGVEIRSPFIWECTRFCLAPGAEPRIAAALMLGAGELMQAFDLEHLVGVFDGRMSRIYRQIGAEPTVLGSAGTGRAKLSVGLWEFSVAAREKVASRAGISPLLSRFWFEQAMGQNRVLAEIA